MPLSAESAGSAAEKAAERKLLKYSQLTDTYSFVPIAFETLGSANSAGVDFVLSVGNRIRAISGDIREVSFLWQRLSVAVHRFNSICLRGTFVASPDS